MTRRRVYITIDGEKHGRVSGERNIVVLHKRTNRKLDEIPFLGENE